MANFQPILVAVVIVCLATGCLSHQHQDSHLSREGQIADGSHIAPVKQVIRSASVERKFIDLSHPLHNGTLHWPKNAGFAYFVTQDGEQLSPQNVTYHLKSDSISMAIHTGTHLDAPVHFGKGKWSALDIPLERLIDVPVVVIDVSEKVKLDRTYSFAREDFINPKTNNSLVQPNSVVLVYTGLSQFYDKGEAAYLGTDTRDINQLKVPGFTREAAQHLVDRQVYGVGLDSISADGSAAIKGSFDPVAHTIFNTNNIYILENVNKRLLELVELQRPRVAAMDPECILLNVAPLPIVDGSGSPVRLVAVTGDDAHCHLASNSCFSIPQPSNIYYSLVTISATLVPLLVGGRGLFSM